MVATIGEVLESIEKKRKVFIDFILKDRNVQEGLFLDDRTHLDSLLEALSSLRMQKIPFYRTWIQKIGEKERRLSVPRPVLNEFISEYLLPLVRSTEVHENSHGGERGWSAKSSLEAHLPCRSVLSLDLRKAFENVSHDRIFNFYRDLASKRGYEDSKWDIAKVLTLLSVVNYAGEKGVLKEGLPQGSSLSTSLYNRILKPLDVVLSKGAEERGFHYTRWIDDLTISSPNREDIGRFLGAVSFTAAHFPVADDKVFFQEDYPMYLLGHKIFEKTVLKNSKEDREANKSPPIDFHKCFASPGVNYDSWNPRNP